MSPNRLYVCDYSNHKVAIFNEHDQLRDFLEISVMDEHVPSFNKTVIENEYPVDTSEPNVNLDDPAKFCPLNVLVTKKCKFLLFYDDDNNYSLDGSSKKITIFFYNMVDF